MGWKGILVGFCLLLIAIVPFLAFPQIHGTEITRGGPFNISSYEFGECIELRRNSNYFYHYSTWEPTNITTNPLVPILTPWAVGIVTAIVVSISGHAYSGYCARKQGRKGSEKP
ncbi:MAG: hypothetical protein GF309_06515 [Candidatus Lokiarchaeota archaeon]|nr:hypothetical protein [Candidatus Lokiarchaeota archaeon]